MIGISYKKIADSFKENKNAHINYLQIFKRQLETINEDEIDIEMLEHTIFPLIVFDSDLECSFENKVLILKKSIPHLFKEIEEEIERIKHQL